MKRNLLRSEKINTNLIGKHLIMLIFDKLGELLEIYNL